MSASSPTPDRGRPRGADPRPARRRIRQDRRHRRRMLAGPGRRALHPHRCDHLARRGHHRPGGFIAATWLRGSTSSTSRPPPAGDGRRCGGRQDGDQHAAAAKNLVGSIHPPIAVICDLTACAASRPLTWPRATRRSSRRASSATTILDLVARDPRSRTRPTGGRSRTGRSGGGGQAGVVADDLTESVDRELGPRDAELRPHARPRDRAVENYTWRHGDAVAVGMMFAAHLGIPVRQPDHAEVDRHRTILES